MIDYTIIMVNVLKIKNKSKSIKHTKRGKKERGCIYFNHDKLSCNNKVSLCYGKLCKICDFYKGTDNKPDQTKNHNTCFSNVDTIIPDTPVQAFIHDTCNTVKLSKDIGTPVHTGYLHSNDNRRHKNRCIYYDNNICNCGKSSVYLSKCCGSTHCKFYEDKPNEQKI